MNKIEYYDNIKEIGTFSTSDQELLGMAQILFKLRYEILLINNFIILFCYYILAMEKT